MSRPVFLQNDGNKDVFLRKALIYTRQRIVDR